MNKNILKQFVSFSYGSIVNLFLSLITTPIITRLFSPNELGLASIFSLTINILTLITIFGTDQAFSRYYYDYFGAEKRSLLKKIGYIVIPIFFIISIIMFSFRTYFSVLLFGQESFSLLIPIMIFTVFANAVLVFSKMIIRMDQKGNLFSMQLVVGKILNFSIAILFLYFIVGNYIALVSAEILGILIISLSLLYINKKYWNSTKTPFIDTSQKEIFYYSYPIALSTFVFWGLQSVDRFALKEFVSFQELGIYVGAFRIVAVLQVATAAFSTYWFPLSYEKFNEDNNDYLFFEKVYTIVSTLFFVFVVLFILSKDLFILVLGVEYREAQYLLPLLVFVPMMQIITNITFVGINFYKKTKLHLVVTSISLIVNILLNIYLIPMLGAKGAALSTAISYIIYFYVYTCFSTKLFKANFHLGKTSLQLIIIFVFAIFNSFFDVKFYLNGAISIFIIAIVLYTNKKHLIEYLVYIK
jgi:O-antigen/teichoic acid export membrane protein